MYVISSIEDAKALEGVEVGLSDWVIVDQNRIDQFAEATGDYQWIHVDTERAAAEMPDGKTIAHGYLTLALIPALTGNFVEVQNLARTILSQQVTPEKLAEYDEFKAEAFDGIVKSGRTQAGARAASSHTGALAAVVVVAAITLANLRGVREAGTSGVRPGASSGTGCSLPGPSQSVQAPKTLSDC